MSHPKSRFRRVLLGLRRGLGALLLLTAAGLFAYALIPRAEAASPHAPEFTFGGLRANLSAEPMAEAARLAERFGAREFSLLLDGQSDRASFSELGLEVDLERLSGQLSAAADPSSALSHHLPTTLRMVELAMPLGDAHARMLGEAASDYAAYSVSWAHDTDGDGHDDILIGAYHYDDGTDTDAGIAYLMYGPVTGAIALGSADASYVGVDATDYAGAGLGGIGDTNDDGYDDFMVGAYGDDTGGSNAGAAYVILGQGL